MWISRLHLYSQLSTTLFLKVTSNLNLCDFPLYIVTLTFCYWPFAFFFTSVEPSLTLSVVVTKSKRK